MKRTLIHLSMTCLALCFVLHAQVTKTGTTAAKFLNIGIGPRGNGMGGAFTSLASDVSALYWNPAGVAEMADRQAMFSHAKLFQDLDVQLNFVGVVIPAGEAGTFGVSVTALDYGDMEVTTEYYPDGIGETFTANSYAFALSYARRLTDAFSAGLTVKYIREDIQNSSAGGIAFDVGTKFATPFFGITFSSMISNYGSKLQMAGEDLLVRHDADPTRKGNNETVDGYYKTDQFEPPLRLQIGLSKELELVEGQKLTLAVDATHPSDNAQFVSTGAELSLFDDLLSLRGGYRTLFLKDSQEGLSLGAGLRYELGVFTIGIDYAYQEFTYLGNIQNFSVQFQF
jgi:hypothetical protein